MCSERASQKAEKSQGDSSIPILDGLEATGQDLSEKCMWLQHTLCHRKIVIQDSLVGWRILDRFLERSYRAMYADHHHLASEVLCVAHFMESLNNPRPAWIVQSHPSTISDNRATSISGRSATSQVHASAPAAMPRAVKVRRGRATRQCKMSRSI